MAVTNKLAASILLLCLSLPAVAQTTPDNSSTPGHHRGHRHGGGYGKALGLSEDQKSKIADIRKNTPEGPEREAAINKVLTADQQAKLAQMKANNKNK